MTSNEATAIPKACVTLAIPDEPQGRRQTVLWRGRKVTGLARTVSHPVAVFWNHLET